MTTPRFHFKTPPLVNHCDANPKRTADPAIQTQLCRSIAELAPAERELIRRLVENLQLLAQTASKCPASSESLNQSIPLVSIGPSGLKGRFQAEY